MKNQSTAKPIMPLAARLALCCAIGTALTVSNGAAVGIAVAAGLYLALTLPGRC